MSLSLLALGCVVLAWAVFELCHAYVKKHLKRSCVFALSQGSVLVLHGFALAFQGLAHVFRGFVPAYEIIFSGREGKGRELQHTALVGRFWSPFWGPRGPQMS